MVVAAVESEDRIRRDLHGELAAAIRNARPGLLAVLSSTPGIEQRTVSRAAALLVRACPRCFARIFHGHTHCPHCGVTVTEPAAPIR